MNRQAAFRAAETAACTAEMLSMHGSVKPSHHTKQKRTLRTSFQPQAIALLLDMKARARDGAVYVFPGVDGKPLAGIIEARII
jgi:hypothetical protein